MGRKSGRKNSKHFAKANFLMLGKILLYFNTIKYLKFSQIFYRIFYFLYRPRITLIKDIVHSQGSGTWVNPISKKESFFSDSEFRFLNTTQKLNLDSDWRKIHINDLWTYNLHYFDGINRPNIGFEKSRKLINSWIKHNPPGESKGWDSYPISLRLVNWIKWAVANKHYDRFLNDSIASQGGWLSKRIEYHLSGNHLLANAKALIFLGLYFDGNEAKKWLRKGEAIYIEELEEQILDDGGHYERSPMYHAIILEDLLDIKNASNYWENKLDKELVKKIDSVIKKMVAWLDSMTHPDGEVSFFNDSAMSISPSINDILGYIERLGFTYESILGFSHLQDSGYISVNSENFHAILDVGELGPNHQPGHAHADTLSFELSLFEKRFIVNSGTSTYSNDDRRSFERSTSAHNTVEINGMNSSQVWKSFRVGKRALPYILSISDSMPVTIRAKHDGYRSIFQSPEHQREWIIENHSLQVNDFIIGNKIRAISRIYFHPEIQIDTDGIFKIPSGGICKLTTSVENYKIIESKWSPCFGKLEKNLCIEFLLREGKNSIIFNWD